jgi:hypothetical protein
MLGPSALVVVHSGSNGFPVFNQKPAVKPKYLVIRKALPIQALSGQGVI